MPGFSANTMPWSWFMAGMSAASGRYAAIVAWLGIVRHRICPGANSIDFI
jgi:hypothetical protein